MTEPHPSREKAPPERRSFFQKLALWATYTTGVAAAAAVGVPFVGFLLGSLRKNKEHWVDLGPVDKLIARFKTNGDSLLETFVLLTFTNPLGQPWDGKAAHTGVYVRYLGKEKEKDQFLIFAMNCAHLGCPVSWFAQSGLFLCPCHGGVYYASGECASGPPPRGLYHCVWRVLDGRLEVQAPHYPTLQDTLRG